jgi:hypothetical protein
MAIVKYRYRKVQSDLQDRVRQIAGPTATFSASDGGVVEDWTIDDVADDPTALHRVLGRFGYTLIDTDPATDPSAAFSPKGAGGGGFIAEFRWSTDTTPTDPGNTRAKADTASFSTISEFYFDDVALSPAFDMGNIFDGLKAGDELVLQQNNDSTKSAIYTIDAVTDNTGWWTLEVTYQDDGGGGTPDNNATVTFGFASVGAVAADTPRQEMIATQAVTTDTALTATLSWAPVVDSVLLIFNGVAKERGATKAYTLGGTGNKTITWLASTGDAEDMDTSDEIMVHYLSSD